MSDTWALITDEGNHFMKSVLEGMNSFKNTTSVLGISEKNTGS